MKRIVKYRSDTVLPDVVVDILEKTKTSLIELSREPDKTHILFDFMRGSLISWFALYGEMINESADR